MFYGTGILAFLGILCIIASMLLMFYSMTASSGTEEHLQVKQERKINGGGVIFIGPVPIIFGSDKNSVYHAHAGFSNYNRNDDFTVDTNSLNYFLLLMPLLCPLLLLCLQVHCFQRQAACSPFLTPSTLLHLQYCFLVLL